MSANASYNISHIISLLVDHGCDLFFIILKSNSKKNMTTIFFFLLVCLFWAHQAFKLKGLLRSTMIRLQWQLLSQRVPVCIYRKTCASQSRKYILNYFLTHFGLLAIHPCIFSIELFINLWLFYWRGYTGITEDIRWRNWTKLSWRDKAPQIN